MESCDRCLDLISARLDGMLTGREERELEAHLAVCPQCRALAGELAQLHAAFPLLEQVRAPEGFARGVMARVRGEKKAVPLFRRPQVRALAGLAACALLCVGLYRVWESGAWEKNGVLSTAPDASQQLSTYALRPDDGSAPGEDVQSAPQSASCALEPGEPEEPAADGSAAPRAALSAAPEPEQPSQSAEQSPAPSVQAPETGERDFTYYQRSASPGAMGSSAEPVQAGATLTLERLPDGGEELLGEAQCGEDGVYSVDVQTAGQLYRLALEQGIAARLSGPEGEGQDCRLVLAP